MKIKLLSAFITISLIISCFAITVSAEEVTQDVSSVRSTVCYNLHGEYCIVIPGSLMMSKGDVLNITTDYLHLTSNESVQVSLNDKTFAWDDEYFKIEHNSTHTLLDCKLYASTSKNSEASEITKSNNATSPIVTFNSDDAETVGKLQVVPQIEKASPAGAYTGTLHFDITLLSE